MRETTIWLALVSLAAFGAANVGLAQDSGPQIRWQLTVFPGELRDARPAQRIVLTGGAAPTIQAAPDWLCNVEFRTGKGDRVFSRGVLTCRAGGFAAQTDNVACGDLVIEQVLHDSVALSLFSGARHVALVALECSTATP